MILGVKICRKKRKFISSLYKKPTFKEFSKIRKVSLNFYPSQEKTGFFRHIDSQEFYHMLSVLKILFGNRTFEDYSHDKQLSPEFY